MEVGETTLQAKSKSWTKAQKTGRNENYRFFKVYLYFTYICIILYHCIFTER